MTEPTQLDNQFTIRNRVARFLDNLAKPSATVTDPAERQKVRFLATVTLAIAGLTAVNLPVRLISGSFVEEPLEFAVYVAVTLALLAAYLLARSAYYRWAPLVSIVALTSVIYASFFLSDPPSPTSFFYLVIIVLFASAILSNRDIFLYATGNVVFLLVGQQLIPKMAFASTGSTIGLMIVSTTLIMVANQHRRRVEQVQQQELRTANQQLQQFSQSLEVRVSERTRDLALAAEVGQAVSQIQDLDQLFIQAVNLIRDRFDLYYVQIYLVHESSQTLVLQAGTGTIGASLLALEHSLAIDHQSINGKAAATRRAIIVQDTQADPLFRPNPALPDTRSEMAVPIMIRDRVVGVLDLQSNQADSLTEAILPAFETLAAQLAVAIENANLLAEMEETTLFLDSIIANIPSILFVKEAEELRYVRVSRGMEELVGLPAAEIEGKNHYDFFPPETAASFAAQDYQALESATLVDVPEETVQGANGTVILHTLKVPILGPDGKPKYLIGISRDITERKQIERQLADRVKQLNLLNEIGRQASEATSIAEFLEWNCRRIPQAMRFPEECLVAIRLADDLFGDPKARQLRRHIVEALEVQGQTIGHIYIAYQNDAHDFVDEESALMGGISRRISSVIETRNLVGQLQTQAESLQKVALISTTVATIRNPYQLTQQVAELIQVQFGLYQTAVFTLEENDLILAGAAGPVSLDMVDQAPSISLQTQKSLVAKGARIRQPILVNDVAADTDFMPHPMLPDTRAEIVTPLLVGDEVLGVLDLQSDAPNSFNEQDQNIFTTLAFQVAISLQNAYQYEQTQSALEELRSLQQVITGESWQGFMANRGHRIRGFVANRQDLQTISVSSDAAPADGAPAAATSLAEESAFTAPVQIRGMTVGKIGVRKQEGSVVSEDNQALLAAISQQVAEALERARLFEETEIARAQTDQLYAGSERVVRATTLDEIMEALVSSTALQWMDRADLLFFDQPWRDEAPPQTMTTAVQADMVGLEAADATGTVLSLAQFPLAGALTRHQPLVINNVHTDTNLDEASRAFLLEELEVSSFVVFPLVVGDQWLGLITARSIAPQDLIDQDVRQISSLVDQAAAVAQTIRLIEETQARAQQEQILRRVSERVYGAVDADSVLRTAVKEVGRVLGLEAFVYLDKPAATLPETGPLKEPEKKANGAGKTKAKAD